MKKWARKNCRQGFEVASYSWYVEMYIGLFLLIPFFNVLWSGLNDKKCRIALIATFLVCTSLPSLLNIFEWNTGNSMYNQLIPEWWSWLYPWIYYFIGAYIKEYGLKISLKKSCIILVLSVILFGCVNFYRNLGMAFKWGIFTDYASVQNVINSVLIFGIILQLSFEKIPEILKRVITMISKNSLGIYLISEVFDKIFYPILCERVINMPNRLEYYVIIVPLILVCSSFSAEVIVKIYELIEKISKKYGVS